MIVRLIAATVLLALGLGAALAAQGLQPGMRTMMQQGGVEHGNQYRHVHPRWRRGIRSGSTRPERIMRRSNRR